MRLTEKETNIIGVETGFYRLKKDYSSSFILDKCGNQRELNSLFLGQQKLGQLEDIEEELGIDLLSLINALCHGIRIFDDGYPYNDRVDLIYSSSNPCGFKGRVSDHCVFFKDYGKTWCLTKEELL